MQDTSSSQPSSEAPLSTPAAPHQPSEDKEKNGLLAAISYLGILSLIVLVAVKDNAFVEHHAKQGLVLFLAWFALWLIRFMLPMLGLFLWMIGSLVIVVAIIVGIVHALRGDLWELPVLGAYAKRIKL